MHLAFHLALLLACLSTAGLLAAEPLDDLGVEAEATGAGTRIADPLASRGAAIQSERPWEPLIRMPAAASGLGAKVALWIRHRGGPLQVKTTDGSGAQHEHPWVWNKPEVWTWTRCGTFPLTEVAGGALVIRGGDGPSALIDIARWTTATASEPADPSPDKPVVIRIDWAQPVGTAGAGAYGLNIFRGWDEHIASDQRYQADLRHLAPGFVRFHTAGGMANGGVCSWLDHATHTWKRDKIAAVLAAFPRDFPRGKAEALITINTIPPWMDQDHDGFLDADQRPAWATLCADLVRIVNVELHGQVGWWEISNE